MSDFEQLRDQLAAHRQQLDQQRREALLAREAVRQSEQALKDFARSETPQREGERARLEKKLRGAQARAGQIEEALAGLLAGEGERLKAFETFTDPRERLRQWPDDSPILLLPLRLETRFKTDAAGQRQLWVRVYPDTCLIDTFDAALTEQEVTNAQAFWAGVWRAGGDEALERAAWRELVASHGSGRAGWIVRRYLPLNPNDKPVKDTATDVLLIIVAPAPLPPAAATFWAAMWRANGDAAAQQAAFAALEQAVGAAQAQEIAERTRPVNFDDEPAEPHTRSDVQVKVAVLQLTPLEDLQTRRASWSSAPRVELLPERFVLVGYSRSGPPLTVLGNLIRTPLAAGPDPNAPPNLQLKPVDDTLQIPEALAWMFDFDKALAAGMAFRINLTAEQATNGFERLIVLGVRLGDSAEAGRGNFEQLLEHHLHSRAGLEIVPQGTPTNNTEKGGAGYSFRDDSDTTFDVFFRDTPQYTIESDPLLRRDGQWLAELLGLRHDLAQRIPNAGGRDQSEARAMQIALWPGTLGYMMKSLLSPIFAEQDVARTRNFFTRYVSGRGPLPALRIGDQPYGILPTTAFDRINWFSQGERVNYPAQLYQILKRIDDDWKPLVEKISYIGKGLRPGGDPHQTLLDVLGLHPNSVEYYPLQAESVAHKFYELAFLNYSVALNFLGLFPAIIPLTLLREFGYTGDQVPDLLNQVYKARQTPLDGPLIDDRPLSERDPIRKYAGERNYIEWLVEAARTSLEALQREQGFDGNKKPAALLYLLLRHALQLSFRETGLRLQAEAGVEVDAAAAREPAFVHVREVQGSESGYALLFRADERVTGRTDVRLGDYIARNLRLVNPDLREQIEALERLSRVPTARLERVFAEHIDCCSYRLDSWKMGLLAWQLEAMREQRQESSGLFLGAYGWLEPVQPEGKTLTPVTLPDDLAQEINRHDKTPLMRDDTNLGLIHAPSINHATTAAVLRNGYVANDGRLAVNLSSRRVRLALEILEGMRNGQSLGALLGYQFERHVHDHGPLQVRDLIYHLRRAFPLAANQIAKTNTETGAAQESIAAMNVVDGRKLIEQIERVNVAAYPFGVETLPRRTEAQETALTNAAAHIRDINDAVADLVLAEGVHQAVLGNYDRSAGTLDAFAKGLYPPEPEVIRTPRSGIALTLRTAIHFSPTPLNPLPAIPLTPLAVAESSVNAWLKDRLPAPAEVGCNVTFTDSVTDTEQTTFISQEQLGLHPIDLLYRAEAETGQALGDLDDAILRFVQANHTPRHDHEIRIRHTERVTNRVTVFELQALLRSLRSLVVAARPLQPADLMRANDSLRDEQTAVTLPKSRIEAPRDDLRDTLLPALDAVATMLGNAGITIDVALSQFAVTVGRFAAYRLPQTGTGFVFEWRAATYAALTAKVTKRLKTWQGCLARYDALIAEYDALPAATPEAERINQLQAAEILISTQLTSPTPASAVYRPALDAKRTAFVNKRNALQQLVDGPRDTLTQLLADAGDIIAAQLPLTDFDPDPFDFADDEQEVARFREQLTGAVQRLKDDTLKRIARVEVLLTQHDTAGATDKVNLLQEAAKVLFGDDFQMIPHISLPATAADELANAWAHSASGDLTRYLTDTAGRDFPVDDWLHGVARVRDKMRQWENAILLGDALPGANAPELTPLQLPYQPGEPWLAMEWPVGHSIAGDRLLYNGHFAEPFDKTKPVCGLLVDEWTEVIPGTEETTGITFHYDRPNSEPPQTWLLALPAVRDGSWSWDELLAAVNDTLDSAKRRALEPVHLDNTAYSWFLPATVSAYTFPEISISNNLLRNAQIYGRLAKE
ncbi:MAG: hypothetical protein ACT4QE_19460 [Anaerolineales bacterium]